jgi:hypothetical protein
MRSPRTPGAGIAGARKSLGGDGVHPNEAGPDTQRRYRLALHRDHEVQGRHSRIERLIHSADALRAGVKL